MEPICKLNSDNLNESVVRIDVIFLKPNLIWLHLLTYKYVSTSTFIDSHFLYILNNMPQQKSML